MSDKYTDNLVVYYEIRMSVLSNYSSIVWNRFNWILTLQLTIFGFYLLNIEKDIPQLRISVLIIGVVVCILWLIMGAEDYVSLKNHKGKTSEIDILLKSKFGNEGIILNNEKNSRLFKFRQSWLLFIFPLTTILIWVYLLQTNI